ncbi:MAG: collagen-like protein [Bacteroides sp.]|nr:collagen-like protein [Bacteroides sp.]
MAIFSSTGFYGFVSSVRKTVEGLYQKHFLSGAAGHGWEIGERSNGKYCLEIDDIVVRNTMTVFELLISKIRAVKGALAITQASGKIGSVWDDEENYYITIEDEMTFVPYDWIRCQRFSHEQRLYHVMVYEVEGNVIVIPKYEFDDQPSRPQAGDELVQFGNRIDKHRQSAIYLHADENGIPAVDVMMGITSKDWSKCVKMRMGGGLPDAPSDWNGLYCENGTIKAVDEDQNEIYMLRPDGSGFVARGNIRWDAEGNGAIFNDAIVWDENGFRFGPDISLSWNNLAEDAKVNLKGEKGEKGDPGEDGANGKDGMDGKDGADGRNGEDGKDANLLDWVEDWDGSNTYIDGKKLLTGRIFGGKQESDGSLTGVAMGYEVFRNKNNQTCSGIFGLVKDEPKFILDPQHNDYQFRGAVYAEEGTIGDLEISNGEVIGRDKEGNTRIKISRGELKDFSELEEVNKVKVSVAGDTGWFDTLVMSYDERFQPSPSNRQSVDTYIYTDFFP